MGRHPRIVIPGLPHHITHRGNRRMTIFRSYDDYASYYALLLEMSERYGIENYAYCLMPNHTHLVSVPPQEDSFSNLMRDMETAYASYFNRLTGGSGHVWDERFYSCVLDDAHLWNAIRYVERNPKRAKLVTRAEDYYSSSAAAHCGLRVDQLLSKVFPPADHGLDWPVWLLTEDEDFVEMIRARTANGRPCATAQFIKELERSLGYPIMPQPPGRKSRRILDY